MLVLAAWTHVAAGPGQACVLPDGCRDLIMRKVPGERPHWFVSPLSGGPEWVALQAGVTLHGFRLLPGVAVEEDALVAAVQGREWEVGDILSRLDAVCRRPDAVAEALDCLASGVESVSEAARLLGVGVRSLQRVTLAGTGRPPGFWLQLARARRAARAVFDGEAIAQAAYTHGYADQPHMTRAFQRWFGASPARLCRTPALGRLLRDPGYD
jgi:AraC-like DNA-binding protein